MTARPIVTVAIIIICLAGCSQSVTQLPQGAQRAASQIRLPLGRSTPPVKFFNTPSQGAWPDYIVSGPQGALWFTEFYKDKIGRITTSGQITEFPLPDDNDIEGIAAGPDGNVWFTEPGASKIGRMTPGGQVTAFPINGPNPSPRGITAGPDGNIWYAEFYDSYIGRVTPSGTITRFQIPGASSFPWDITTGPDGDLWFTESATNQIGRFDPRTQQFKPSLNVPTGSSNPWGILLAPDRRIWFTERTGDKLAVVANSKILEFAIPQAGSYPEKIAAAAGKLWFTEMQTGNVGQFNPKTGKFGRIISLSSGSIPIGMATGPDKNVWFTIASYSNQSQIGEIVLH